MSGHIRTRLWDDDFEVLFLISQALQSEMPLPEAIRLALEGRPQRDSVRIAAFRRLAEAIERGDDPESAVYRVGLRHHTAGMFSTAIRSANFAETFAELVRIEDSRLFTARKIRQILFYPALLFLLFFFVVMLFFRFLLPMFKGIFESYDMTLPLLTEVSMKLSEPFEHPLIFYEVIFVAVFLYLVCRFFCPKVWYYVPLLGGVAKSLNQCGIMRQLAAQFLQGIPLHEALDNCGKMMRNPGYRRECRSAARAAEKGMVFREIAMRYYWLFPSWVFPMFAAESSGEMLARSLRRAVETEENKIVTSLEVLRTILMPIFLIIFLNFVTFAMLVMFLPLIRLISDMT